MSAKRIVALVSRRCEPIDGVADYCECLSGAVEREGHQFETFCVNWQERGWRVALADLEEKARAWHGCWVLLQYTTLGWSRRSFPLHAPRILSILRKSGARCGVVFHDFGPFVGKGMIDHARRYFQLRALKSLYELAERAIFTVPLEKISWLPAAHDKAVYIPVGANCPEISRDVHRDSSEAKTVAVYCVTGGRHMNVEVRAIGHAMKRACGTAGRLRLIVFGTGSQEADSALKAEFAGTGVDVETLGLLSPDDVSRTLDRADVMLFVRGQISSRRSSAMAGIACGLPIVCYAGPETGWPITEAGIVSVPLGDRDALSEALEKVLSDEALRSALCQRNRRVQEQYFSWNAIAARYADTLEKSGNEPVGNAVAETAVVAHTR